MDTPLANVDLNLLVALRTLLEERSVTKAAERLFITQPAMSKTLQRLRDLFNDELFTRSSQGLIPTPRALALDLPVQQALEFLESKVFGSEFEPASASGEIHICGPEMFTMSAVPELAGYIAEHAPGVLLQSRNLLDDYLELLAHGTLDFAICADQGQINSADYITHPILAGNPSVWLPADHPLAQQESVRIAELKGMPSVSVYMPGFTSVVVARLRSIFESQGVNMKTVLQTTQVFIAMEIISLQGAFMLAPNVLENSLLAKDTVVARPLADIELFEGGSLSLALVQHQRTLNSSLHNWFRDLILDLYLRYQSSP